MWGVGAPVRGGIKTRLRIDVRAEVGYRGWDRGVGGIWKAYTVHAQRRAGGHHAERVGATHGLGRRGERGGAAGQRALHKGTDIALFGARGAQLVGQRRGVGLVYEVVPLVQVLLHVGLLGSGLGL